MSKKKTKTSKRKSQPFSDPRIPKIIGILFLFFSFYLLVAFISYLFTWKADQDKVLMYSWSIIFDGDLTVTNWLGRLGAFISNTFMYWGFGVSSFLFIPLFWKFGVDLIRTKSIKDALSLSKYIILFVAFLSILLEFVFQSSSFTWGGIFGTSTTYWLINFIGRIGLSLLLFFSTIIFLTWVFNPSFEKLQLSIPEGAKFDFQLPSFDFFKASPKSTTKNKKRSKTDPLQDENSAEDDNRHFSALKPNFAKNLDRAIPKTDSDGKPARAISDDNQLEFEVPESISSKPNRSQKTPAVPKPLEMEISGSDINVTEGNAISVEETATAEKPILGIDENNVDHSEPYDPTKDLRSYKKPSVELLEDYADHKYEIDRSELEANKDQIIETLLNYKIEIVKIRATIGPTVTLYEIVPAPGVKISKIKNLEDDIALSLSALGIRIIAPIPGKGTIGIEVPNKKPQIVSLKEVLKSDKFVNAKMDLPIALGKTIANEVFVADLAKMPHLLIAGATGQGKSVGINTVLMSLLYKKHPSQVKLVLVDPKKVELFPYSSLVKHFLAYLPDSEEPIITETKKVVHTINSLCIEMDERYDLLKKARSRNLKEYNQKFIARKLNPNNGHKFMPFIVLVIDEFADLIMTAGKEVELPIARLAQLARAVGIHLIIATQRPSVNIITGTIKANFPARIAFKVTSKIDSRTILDTGGADQLIGRGDMLLSVGGNIVRLQCAFVDTPEVESVITGISDQQGYPDGFHLPEYLDEDREVGSSNLKMSDLDEHFEDAARLVVASQSGSTSMIQRKMQLGYNRAGRIMDQMEALGIVGESRGSKPREVLYHSEMELMNYLDHLKSK
jgi:S-DNA-T family DNA segregation ATPase FtsK/SpoIIIE